MELIEVAEMYALGAMLAEELPTAAADALGAGYDSPALCQLAGAHGADAESIRKLFRKSLGELGIPVPPPSQAGSAMARRVAGAIASGAVIPYDGARRIWWEIYARFPQLKELRPFVALASDYEDDEADRANYSRMIVEESKKLLARPDG